MFKVNQRNRILRKATAYLLVFVMVFGLLPAVSFARDDSLPTLSEPAHISQEDQMSQARRNYFALLEGNYPSSIMRQRFTELFGEHSIDDIRNNFHIIFDMPRELVDEGLVGILTTLPTSLPAAEVT